MVIELVQQGQVFVATKVCDLVDFNGFNVAKFSMRQAPRHHPVNRAINGLSTCSEDRRSLVPATPLDPSGEKDTNAARSSECCRCV